MAGTWGTEKPMTKRAHVLLGAGTYPVVFRVVLVGLRGSQGLLGWGPDITESKTSPIPCTASPVFPHAVPVSPHDRGIGGTDPVPVCGTVHPTPQNPHSALPVSSLGTVPGHNSLLCLPLARTCVSTPPAPVAEARDALIGAVLPFPVNDAGEVLSGPAWGSPSPCPSVPAVTHGMHASIPPPLL